MECPICKSKETTKVCSDFTGYVEGTDYDILECETCNTQFISMEKLNTKLYDIIYSNKNTPGYDRYLAYAKKVKNHMNPLRFLSEAESAYYPIHHVLTNAKPGLEILEVGCGYGYLTYALNQMGHHAIGIDISKNAINYAKSNFGNHFQLSSLADFKTNQKFDIIVATELIEHLDNPAGFIHGCVNLLKDGGKILLTTPKKDFAPKKAIWKTDLPPVHTTWLSKKSFKNIARQNSLDCNFADFSRYVARGENKLICYILDRINRIPEHVVDKYGNPFHKRVAVSDSFLIKNVKKVMFSTPINHICHLFANFLSSEDIALGVILSKTQKKISII